MFLDTGDRKSVKFEWVITEWSDCSPPCGGNGFQVRLSLLLLQWLRYIYNLFRWWWTTPLGDMNFKHTLLSMLSHINICLLADESSSLHGQTEQYDTERGQQLVWGRPITDPRHHTKVWNGWLSAVVGNRMETVWGVQMFHLEYWCESKLIIS